MTRDNALSWLENHWKLGALVIALLAFWGNANARIASAEAEILTNKRRIAEAEVGMAGTNELLRDIRERVVRVESMLERIVSEKCLED